MTDARLDAGPGLAIMAAQATVDDAGAVHATVVHATVAQTIVAQTIGTPPRPTAPSEGEERPTLEVTAPSSDWDLQRRTVRFSGGVELSRGPVLMRCQELSLVYADADHIDHAEATGDVVVVRADRHASAARAVLTAADGTLSLTGGARISDGPNTLTGDQIVLFLDDERVRCDACRLVVAGDALQPR